MDNRKKSINYMFLLLFLALFSNEASAQDTLNASHAANHNFYVPGAVLTLTNRIEYTGTLTSLGMMVNIPVGWFYVSVSSGGPMVRVTEAGELEMFWKSVPESPVEFKYMLKIPEGEAQSEQTQRSIDSQILHHRSSEGELNAHALPNPLSLTRSAEVAGDINDDGSVTLADAVIALRVAAGIATAAGVRGDYAASGIDVNGDDKVGIDEAGYVLIKLVMQKK
jgi:hypothetical protein